MNPRDHAEKATLGAILNDPRHLTDLSEWLSPEDFASPQHIEIYRAMLILDERGATPDPVGATGGDQAERTAAYAAELATYVTSTDTRGVDLPYMHTLMQACPRTEHAPYYGRMVVEADTHRTIIENATRLAQISHEQRQQSSSFGLEHLFVHTGAFRQVVDNLAERWGIGPDELDHPDAANPTIARAADTRTAGFADQLAPELDAPPTPAEHAAATEREDMLLACILRNPDQLDDVRAWLDPDDFAAAGRGDCYRAALDLHDRGDPVDPLTLAWETHKHPTQAHATNNQTADGKEAAAEAAPLNGERLMKLYGDGYPAQVAPYYARQVLENSIRATTAQAARDLKALASNPSIAATELLTSAAHRIDQVNNQETRWHTSHPAEPQQPDHPAEQQSGASQAL